MNKYLLVFSSFAFFLLVYVGFVNSKPSSKASIYKEIKEYSPYYLDKRFGGLKIKSRVDKNFEEKPSSMEVFHRLEQLEHDWGQKSLVLDNKKLLIKDENDKIIKIIEIKSKEDEDFIKKYYGIK